MKVFDSVFESTQKTGALLATTCFAGIAVLMSFA
jgi:hypothetical protein